jgi:predicted lipoprotein with Yx(FWY)xxD motif
MRRAGLKVLRLWAAVLGVGLAAVVGAATAKAPPTLGVFQSTVTNFLSPNTHTTNSAKIVGASGGFSVYTLTGDSRNHPQCLSKACRAIWPWVAVKNGVTPTKNPLIKAKLGIWKHNGVNQLTLGGHPLYFYFQDKSKKRARGEGIVSFGGTWHVWKVSSSSTSTSTMPMTMPMPTPMPTPTPTPPPNPYPLPY